MSLLDFIFPKYSLRGLEGKWITQSELRHLTSCPQIFESNTLKKRGVCSLDRLFSASAYHECPLLKRAVATFKYKRVCAVGEILKLLLINAIGDFYVLKGDSCLCPVPLYFARACRRGFNQAEVLARGISETYDIPVHNMLSRIRPTGSQTKRNRIDRMCAMKGAFIARKSFKPVRPLCVYLVDDLFTTGATMDECASVLKKAGAKRVEGIVLAHG